MTAQTLRFQQLAELPTTTDLLVIGGGICGAGIALEAARRGVRVLLVEARDFAFGTSSRSSKLVHGGLRYLKQGKPRLTFESLRERNQLLRDVPGLVDPLGFVMAHHRGRPPGRAILQLGLALYDWLSGQTQRGWCQPEALPWLAPGIDPQGLTGASLYQDASTDDARLVLRVLFEAQARGATLINYLSVQSLLRDPRGQVTGARLCCAETGALHELHAACTIAATGVWTDQLRANVASTAISPRLRPLRGSHILLPGWRLPLARAVAFMHPQDGRPVFAYPWQGTTLVGTTDLDHPDLEQEPAMTRGEADYLLDGLNRQFPGLSAGLGDILSSWAGVRPVIDSGKGLAPSQESREHRVLEEHGLISVIGGKLTTFRTIARDVLRRAAPRLPMLRPAGGDRAIIPVCPAPPNLARVPAGFQQRLLGRYGPALAALIDSAGPDELVPIADSQTLWAELRWAAQNEYVQHLDDLLLRRSRIGLTLRAGGEAVLPRLQTLLLQLPGWDSARWAAELARYRRVIARCYSVPS